MDKGADFVVRGNLPDLVRGMNDLTGANLIDLDDLERQILARDRELTNTFTKDLQITALRGARNYRGDKLIRVAPPHRILDPKAGPLIAVRLNILTRKSLGGLQTDLDSRVLRTDGTPLPGVYAAGEVAGFGGGGMHGYRSLRRWMSLHRPDSRPRGCQGSVIKCPRSTPETARLCAAIRCLRGEATSSVTACAASSLCPQPRFCSPG